MLTHEINNDMTRCKLKHESGEPARPGDPDVIAYAANVALTLSREVVGIRQMPDRKTVEIILRLPPPAGPKVVSIV